MNNYIEELACNGYVFSYSVPRTVIHINQGLMTPSVFFMDVKPEDDRSCHDIYHEFYLSAKDKSEWKNSLCQEYLADIKSALGL